MKNKFINSMELFTANTIVEFNNLQNVQMVKFKGRKSANLKLINTFDPNQYVILTKNEDYYTSNINYNNKIYTLVYDQHYNIIGYVNHLNNVILFDKDNNESFTVKPSNSSTAANSN